jgi:hypothetical protein
MHLLPSQPNRLSLAIACAGGVLLAVLAAGGPFFDMAHPAVARPVQLKFIPGDGMVVTAAGTYDPGTRTFATKHAEGALVYGPYMTLQPGHYAVSWTGVARRATASRFEVFSTRDGVIASSDTAVPVSAASAVLQRVEFDMPETRSGVELRVIVGAGDELAIDGVTLDVSQAGEGAKHD